MLDFAHPYYLFLLFLIPVIWLLYFLSRLSLRRKLKKFGRLEIVRSLMPDASRYKGALKLTLRTLGLIALIIAISRPRYGEKEETTTSGGAEIVIAFDVSQSMLAPSTDDPGSISRNERARMLLEKLVNDLSRDKIGLVVFAANARMQMPLTSDKRLIRMALQNELTPGIMSNQGTSISQAIEMSALSFPGLRDASEENNINLSNEEDGIHRAIILITDAEDHEGDAVEMAEEMASRGIQIDVIGVGTKLGGKIPLGNNRYLRDSDGNEVVTTLNEDAAAKIAQAGGGVYVNAADPNASEILKESLNKLKQTEVESVTYKMNAEQFPLFVWIALICFMLDIFVLNRKTRWLKGVNFFQRTRNVKKIHIIVLVLVTGIGLSSCTQHIESNKVERNAIKSGNKAYNQREYLSAIEDYNEAIESNPQSDVAKFNLALATLVSNETDSLARVTADSLLRVLAANNLNPEVSENAIYTMSNFSVYVGDELKNQSKMEADQSMAQQLNSKSVEFYKQAIEGYKELLRRKPGDLKVTQNLRIVQLKLPPEDENQQDQQQDQQEQQQDQQEQEQQQQQQQQQQPQADALNALEKRENQTRKRQVVPVTPQRTSTDKPW